MLTPCTLVRLLFFYSASIGKRESKKTFSLGHMCTTFKQVDIFNPIALDAWGTISMLVEKLATETCKCLGMR